MNAAGAYLSILVMALLCACRATDGTDDFVEVLYAGSLTAVMEDVLGPAFSQRTGVGFRGEPSGSVAGARLVSGGVRRPDVYLTADRMTLSLLQPYWEDWAVTFAHGELALAYASSSRYGASLDSAAAGLVPWYDVLLRPGFRLGRTDPELDPKGYRTLWLFELTGRYYRDPLLGRRLMEAAGAGRLVFPEAHLASRVEAGQLDAGVFYLAEARSHGLLVVPLPDGINLGSPGPAALYESLEYRTLDGEEVRGAPVAYTATIPSNARNREAALDFIRFLVSPDAGRLLEAAGLPPAGRLTGARRAPPSVRELLPEDRE